MDDEDLNVLAGAMEKLVAGDTYGSYSGVNLTEEEARVVVNALQQFAQFFDMVFPSGGLN